MRKFEICCSVEEYASADQLPAPFAGLCAAAGEALNAAYAPYSQFHVGAALLLEDGTIVPGSNQENAAYPSGLCAERVALFSAGSLYPGKRIVALAVTTSYSLDTPIAPCGACRQVMAEYALKQDAPIEIFMLQKDGIIFRMQNVKDLLPLYFSGEWLKK